MLPPSASALECAPCHTPSLLKNAETVTKGSADEKLDAAGRPDGRVRMHDRDTVGLALLALEEGMTLAGPPRSPACP